MTIASTLPPLNQGQDTAAEKFFEFLLSDERYFVLKGPAGVGKTHWMRYVIDVVIPRYNQACQLMGIPAHYTEVALCATTNKAVEQLHLATRHPCETVHSFLNLKVKEDYKSGKTILTKTNSWRVHENTVLFIDEYSMIDTELLNIINEGTHQCKIVFLGDHCQMNPVMEKVSPVTALACPSFELTEPMRTKNPHLHALNQQMRNTVLTGVFNPIQVVPGVIDWLDDAQMQIELDTMFKDQTADARILAYTNKQVMLFNDYIRGMRNLPDEYIVGEFLVNNSAVQVGNDMLSVEAEVEVLSVSGLEQVHIEQDVDLTIRRMNLQASDGRIFKDVRVPVDRAHYASLIQHFQRKKNWERYFFLKKNFPDLRQRDASTVYKAQGSSYDVAYVDLGNIGTCHNPDQAARMLYVGPSRARHRVVLYGTLPEKYGSIIL